MPQCLKFFTKNKINLLVFILGFVVGMAIFRGLWWLIMVRFDRYRELGIYLMSPFIFLLVPLFYIKERLNINLNEFWFVTLGWGLVVGLFFLLVKWFFVKLKH